MDAAMHAQNYPCHFIDRVLSSGAEREGEIAQIAEYHAAQQVRVEEEEQKIFRDVEMLCSRWIDREPPIGAQVLLTDGLFTVFDRIIGGGAFVALLKNEANYKLVCRGTAFRSNATGALDSGINDLNIDIGMRGVEAVWHELKGKLAGIEEVEILGKSMGGAHAQMLAALIAGKSGTRVTAIKTLASVGAPTRANEILKEKLPGLPVMVLRNNQDYIPAVGGDHIGEGLDPSVYYMAPEGCEIEEFPADPSLPTLAWRFLASFSAAHSMQITLQDRFTVRKVPQAELPRHLSIGRVFDGGRAPLAAFCSIFIRQLTFSEFYDSV